MRCFLNLFCFTNSSYLNVEQVKTLEMYSKFCCCCCLIEKILNILDPPSIHLSTRVARVALGERARLTCTVRGNPRPGVEWRLTAGAGGRGKAGAAIRDWKLDLEEEEEEEEGGARHSVEYKLAERAVSTHLDVVFSSKNFIDVVVISIDYCENVILLW